MKKLILDRVIAGEKVMNLSKEFNIPFQTIYCWCYKENIDCNTKKRVKTNPFDLTNLDAQYYIGLLATDGCVTNARNINISLTDEYPIKKFAEFLNINYYTKFYGKSMRYIISFSNKEVFDFLGSIGITPNKSRTLTISTPITWSMLRGIMDGDGSYSYKLYNGRTSRQASLKSSSISFVTQVSEFLNINNIKNNISLDIYHGYPQYKLSIHVRDISRYYDNLYYDGCVYIPRKKETLELIVNHIDKRLAKSK
jgi:hypothetical protein